MNMQVTKFSIISGLQRTVELPVTPEQLNRIAAGELVQIVCPDLSADEREFLISGAWDDEWDNLFAGKESFAQEPMGAALEGDDEEEIDDAEEIDEEDDEEDEDDEDEEDDDEEESEDEGDDAQDAEEAEEVKPVSGLDDDGEND
jgi:hypothetical protein